MSTVQQLTAIFLGTQGSGKGTQLQLVKDYLATHDPNRGVVHVEMGKLLRALQAEDTYAGHRTKELLEGGNLIPYAISAAKFALYLVDNVKAGDEHVLIDGFPRTADQVPTLDSAMQFFDRKDIVVVNLNISDDEAIKRLLPRGRYDDTAESIRKRLAWSREQTLPNIEWFRKTPGYRVADIFGERPIEVVHQDILTALGLTS